MMKHLDSERATTRLQSSEERAEAWRTANRKQPMEKPTKITLARLQVVVMPNGEVFCFGKLLGQFDRLKVFLVPETIENIERGG